MVSGLDPPNTGVWHSNMERARLRSFPRCHAPNAHPAPLEQRTATGSPGPGPAAGWKPLHRKLDGEPFMACQVGQDLKRL